MFQFDKPINLNGEELITELKAAGVVTNDYPTIDGNGDFWLDVSEADKDKAAAVVAAHNGTTIVPDRLAAKQALLAKLGITADELKTLLS